MTLSRMAVIGLALLAGCALQVQQYESNQPVQAQAQAAPQLTFCLDMTMAGCQPPQPSDGAFGGCENLDPLEQQEQGCWEGRSRE